uniref:Uncharacterized protein AlNc14C221G9110 n=1 Tax=Albugo laibachii Nc14 TaxID=890382 RepID=F0WRW8_9STRA|nr:conserved hypothetical protein [Albugo laibachii Nc14]|eukprot:CCA24084.1 conserved hypothetical protein [Albugo laibachii Nc14]
MEAAPHFVTPLEAERMIESSIREIHPSAIGIDEKWLSYHHIIEKLNLQAHQSAQQNQDSFVLEALLTYLKLPILVQNLLTVESWKQFILPKIESKENERASMRLYFIMYHEATLSNVLEIAFHHQHIVESFQDEELIEVIDYCVRKLTWIVRVPREKIVQVTGFHKSGHEMIQMLQSTHPKEDLARQEMELEFRITVQSLTILRYICQELHMLSLSIVSRLLDKHDVLLTLVVLIENSPWTHRATVKNTLAESNDKEATKTIWKKFVHQKWKVVEPSELLVLTPTEAQPWIAVYYLLCTESSRTHYEMTQFRKDQLLRIRKYINEFLVDQLPFLVDVQRYLDELALMQVSSTGSSGKHGNLILEAVPRLSDSINQYTRQHAKEIAEEFDKKSEHFCREDDLKQLGDIYQLEGIADLLEGRQDEKIHNSEMGPEDHENEVQETLHPIQVNVLIREGPPQEDNCSQRPLIVEIGSEDGKTREEPETQPIEIHYTVDATQVKEIDTSPIPYLRYPLHENTAQNPPSMSFSNNVSVKVAIRFESNMPKRDEEVIELRSENLALPGKSSGKEVKAWGQIGSLESRAPCVLQYQVIADHKNLDVNRFNIGPAFLCVPRGKVP